MPSKITIGSMQDEFKNANEIRTREEPYTLVGSSTKRKEAHARSGPDFTTSQEYQIDETQVGISFTKGNYRNYYYRDDISDDELDEIYADPRKMKPTEDRAGVFALGKDAFEGFTEEEIGQCIYDAVCRLVSLAAQMQLRSGSTILISLSDKNKIYTASLGDSCAILVAKNKPEENFSAFYLNRLNNVSSPTELERIRQEGGKINDGQLMGQEYTSFNVTGGLGDSDAAAGFKRAPTVSIVDVTGKISPTLILGSDGLGDVTPKGFLADLYDQSMGDQSPQDQARELRCLADMCGSDDDITALVMPVSGTSKKPIVSYVADGHGGSAVAAQFVVNNIERELNFVIEKRREAKQAAEAFRSLEKIDSLPAKVKEEVKKAADTFVEETSKKLRDGLPAGQITPQAPAVIKYETETMLCTVYGRNVKRDQKVKSFTAYENKVKSSGWDVCVGIVNAVCSTILELTSSFYNKVKNKGTCSVEARDEISSQPYRPSIRVVL